jgi:deoxyribodipyrimidine photolyase-related protein
MTIGIWILGDQLWTGQAALVNRQNYLTATPVILIESYNHIQQRPYHQQKLVLVWSAMRHFAEELKTLGWSVTYEIGADFQAILSAWVKRLGISELQVMIPNDLPFMKLINNLNLECKITLIDNNHFIWTSEDFNHWAKSRKRLLLEDFYREGRKRWQILMSDNQPIGRQWNFDKQNRKPPKEKLKTPNPLWFEPDEITRQVIADVAALDIPKYGKIVPFRWGVTRRQALQVLENFIRNSLPTFGPYQDAMVTGEETLWHSLLSPYLNLGLLTPLEVIEAVQIAYTRDNLELNSVEGFIRQILGWREYMRGVYHYLGEDYSHHNWFNHQQPLPPFFWDRNQTEMNCLKQVLSQVENTGYAHHIQRLMILSNFALIFGVSPQEIESWFHSAFIDAYDWVMQTNVLGMGQFADGGILASKPYASSANYIDKMSDYCRGCVYKKNERVGDLACPFNFLYWDFLARHREKLQSQGRVNMILGNLDRMSADELNQIQLQSQKLREQANDN